ncbi:unnamed protein product, partial [Rotaria magnacalcarata]
VLLGKSHRGPEYPV